ncbi:protein starmaker [Ceratina calcarata]|uniref:Protein starmaker n=1 Tax=Ceratina calcarata TaxID=156304 RepID=A0AAJ7N7Y9_9HYME|nr:protein starmaker [Ceratina calcarata]XP_017882110.1 protein starmaker [Ceratina calcarata]XP_026670456.1 protein starmaker [Ceratina calcarata]
MTTMDSDSESQDSDDGRRFRFEATRKDTVQGKLSRSESEQEFGCNAAGLYEDRKDKPKHSCNRGEHRLLRDQDINDKDSKHSTRNSRHSSESRSLRHEDKEHRNARDSGTDSKHKTRSMKRHKNRDRSEHRSNRSQERCRSRNENDRFQSDKHRNKSRDKCRHHSSEKSHDKSHIRSADHGKPRGESEKCNTYRKMSTKGSEEQEYSSKHIEQSRSGHEEEMKRDLSAESQELNLSEFDILSETDGNMSDSSDVKSKSPPSKKRNLDDGYENASKKQLINEFEPFEGSLKVNERKDDVLHGSSNNHSGTISDSTLGTGSMNVSERTSLSADNSESMKATNIALSEEKIIIYGPPLPPQLLANSSNDTELENDKHFIGPSLPKSDESETIENPTLSDDATHEDSDSVFGPALPPHLLKQQSNDETVRRVIGPTLPSDFQSFNSDEINQMETDEKEEEEEDDIGPLPADHPALETNYVHKQLERRAQRIKNEQKHEDNNTLNQREEWMTELPSAQVNNLGLTSRKFRIKEGPDMTDRSCWTDTPAKKAERKRRQEEEKLYEASRTVTTEMPKKNETEKTKGKKSEKSLLEIHQSKLRKKKKKEEKEAKSSGLTIRRPFDRDTDLQINRFDQTRKNAIINKAQYLDERFSRGKFS